MGLFLVLKKNWVFLEIINWGDNYKVRIICGIFYVTKRLVEIVFTTS